ncbi:MAG: YbjN domain-containing protein [Parvularculaceae bacterium]
MQDINADLALSILAGLNLNGELRSDGASDPFVVVTTSGGAKFILRFIGCNDRVLATGCASVVANTAFSNAGATYDELNAFNGTASVTTVINSASDGLIIFGRHVIVTGGVTTNNFGLEVALFLVDVQRFIDARNAVGTAISFDRSRGPKSKIDGFAGPDAQGPSPVMTSESGAAETGVAVVNQWSAEFVTDAVKAFVK